MAEHEPCLIVAQCVTEQCKVGWDKNEPDCPHCMQPHELVFEYKEGAPSPAIAFLDWIGQRKQQTLCIMHNFSGYDGHLLLRAAVDAGRTPTTLNMGMKTYSMEYGRATFKVCSPLMYVGVGMGRPDRTAVQSGSGLFALKSGVGVGMGRPDRTAVRKSPVRSGSGLVALKSGPDRPG